MLGYLCTAPGNLLLSSLPFYVNNFAGGFETLPLRGSSASVQAPRTIGTEVVRILSGRHGILPLHIDVPVPQVKMAKGARGVFALQRVPALFQGRSTTRALRTKVVDHRGPS
jgi:hypothetical protein